MNEPLILPPASPNADLGGKSAKTAANVAAPPKSEAMASVFPAWDLLPPVTLVRRPVRKA